MNRSAPRPTDPHRGGCQQRGEILFGELIEHGQFADKISVPCGQTGR